MYIIEDAGGGAVTTNKIELANSNNHTQLGIIDDGTPDTGLDVFQVGSNMRALLMDGSLNVSATVLTEDLEVWDINLSAALVTQSSFSVNYNPWLYYTAVTSTTKAHFIITHTNATDPELWVFDDTSDTLTKLQGCGSSYQCCGTKWADKKQRVIAYDGTDSLYFILKKTADGKSYLVKYGITSDTLTITSNEYNVGLMPDRNCRGTSNTPWQYEKGFHTTSSYIYQITRGYDYLLKLQDISLSGSETILAISDKYLITSNADLYEYTNYMDKTAEAIGIYNIYKLPKTKAKFYDLLAIDQVMEIWENDSGTRQLCFTGKLGIPTYNQRKRVYTYNLKNVGETDLRDTITHTASSESIGSCFLNCLSGAVYLHGDTDSIQQVSETVSYTWDDQRREDAFYTLCVRANAFYNIEPDGKVYFQKWDNKNSSGIVWHHSSHNLSTPKTARQLQQYNTFTVYGGWDNTNSDYYSTTYQDSEHVLQYGKLEWKGRTQFPEARSQAAISAIATALKDWQGMQDNPYTATFRAANHNYIQVGSSSDITFGFLEGFSAARSMAIGAYELDFKTNTHKITVTEDIVKRR